MVGAFSSDGTDGGINNGPKIVNPVRIGTRLVDHTGRVWEGPSIPMDAQARFAYHSRMGGVVPVEVAIDSIFANPAHYGAGGFEGLRVFRTRYGEAFPQLELNIARLIYSSLAFNLALVTETLAYLDDPNVVRTEHLQRTPAQFFDDAAAAAREGHDITMDVILHMKDGAKVHRAVPFEFIVKFDGTYRKMCMQELNAAICSLALLNGLVRGGAYPDSAFDIIPGGYTRPFFWISGEDGLKVPTMLVKEGRLVSKPMFFGIGTLPWGRYLSDDGYNAGLDVLIGPYPRIDSAMPVSQKISGNYVNSARNINIAMLLGYGEVIALNHNDQLVEGSAENLVFLFRRRGSSELVAYCPPLSSDILAGTTRDRVIRILQEGLIVDGNKVELVMEAPQRKYVLASLEGRTNMEFVSLVLMGTGVGIIHARSITYNPALPDWVQCNELLSEEARPDPWILVRLKETERKHMINGGEKHAFVDALQSALNKFLLDGNGTRLTPLYDMDYDIAAKQVFGVSLDDVAGKEFAAKARDGHFTQRINGLQQPQELLGRYREALTAVQKMAQQSIMDRTRHVTCLIPHMRSRRGNCDK